MRQDLSPSKIKLRRLSGEDNLKTFNWRNDERIFKWCRQNDVLHADQHNKWFGSQSQDRSISMYAIESTEGATLVGVCGFTSIDLINRHAEFSMYIGPEYHKRGYGEAALRELVRKGFRDYGFNSIWGETFDGNPAIKLFEKVGFKREGSRRDFYFRDGKFIDAHLVSILRSEYDLANYQRAA